LKFRSLTLVAVAATLILAIACGSSDDSSDTPAAPAAPAAPAVDVAQAIKDAVASVPQGASAADIQGLVSKAVTEAVTEAVTAATAGQAQGITRADVEAAVNAASAGSLSAADVQRIVDQSVRSLPAPQIDTNQLRSMIAASVAASVPEGVSATEISRMVELAVGAASAGAVTQGDLQDLVAKSIQDAAATSAAGQLTAAEVQKIVAASLAATNTAIEGATSAANAAQAAAQEAVDAAAAAAALAAPDAVVAVDQGTYVAEKISPGSYGTAFHILAGPSNANVPQVPYNESPMSAALVRQGTILPVDQRLPDWANVAIIPPGDEIGAYGGSLRSTGRNITQTDMGMGYGLEMSPDGLLLVPSVFKTFEATEDGREFTFQIRKGARWSDGYPHTIEDVRFALEDLMLNKELMPGLPPVLKSPLTGNDMRVQFVDDETFKVFFDDPNFSFMESSAMNIYSGIKGCPRCFISPSHVQKRYHIKWNNAEIPALLEKNNQPDWVKNFSFIRNVRGFDGTASEPIPTVADTKYMYKGDNHYNPVFGGFWARNQKGGAEVHEFERNHYHPAIDPEGNQLPYMDEWIGINTESREVGVFRSMNGESDWNRWVLVTKEMPLYLANSIKGDYSIIKHDSPDGSDATMIVNQEFTVDSELGSLLRTQDFRIALAEAWDRNGMNNTLAAGLGTTQNMVPHPSTPYFPGEASRMIHAEYDLDAAKAKMAALGYTDADGDGFLDRKTDGKPLSLIFNATARYYPFGEWLAQDWGKLGIKMEVSEDRPYAGSRRVEPTEYFEMFSSTEGGANPWSSGNQRLVNIALHNGSPAIGQYFATRGEEGMAPTGGDAAYTDIYGRMAPDGTYPADISGDMLRIQEMYAEGQIVSMLSPKRTSLGKSMFKMNSANQMKIGSLAYAGLFRSLKMKRNNVRNVPKNWSPAGGHPMEWFAFEDGIDNLHNPGNRSKRYRTVNFYDPAYWD
jgi:peptide/nickel transport system substrate-binding protein